MELPAEIFATMKNPLLQFQSLLEDFMNATGTNIRRKVVASLGPEGETCFILIETSTRKRRNVFSLFAMIDYIDWDLHEEISVALFAIDEKEKRLFFVRDDRLY